MRISGQGRITIPKPLRDRLGLDCGAEVEVTPHDGGVLIRRRDAADAVQAAVGGRLREVDTKQRTAQLHEYGRPGHIPLRFGPDLDAEMRRLETQYVEVRGAGRIDDDRDRWIEVWVEELRMRPARGGSRSTSRPSSTIPTRSSSTRTRSSRSTCRMRSSSRSSMPSA